MCERMPVKCATGGRGVPTNKKIIIKNEQTDKQTNIDFVDNMVLNVSVYLPFNQNQPLQLADDLYIRTLKNKRKELGMY